MAMRGKTGWTPSLAMGYRKSEASVTISMRSTRYTWLDRLRWPLILGLLLLVASLPPRRVLTDAGKPAEVWAPLVERLAADGHDPGELRVVFGDSRARHEPSAMATKLKALLRQRAKGPGASAEEPEVYRQYLSPLALAGARGYLDLHGESLEAAEQAHGVSKEILVAILLIESKLGLTLGDESALVTLASMAACGDFDLVKPHIGWDGLGSEEQAWIAGRNADKAAWAYRELDALLRYAKAASRSPLDIPSSVWGAIGYPQFMPTNALAYGLDGDGDGKVDLFAIPDALHSLGNFLKRHGWRAGLSPERRHEVIYKYNHNNTYARTVLAIAERLGE